MSQVERLKSGALCLEYVSRKCLPHQHAALQVQCNFVLFVRRGSGWSLVMHSLASFLHFFTPPFLTLSHNCSAWFPNVHLIYRPHSCCTVNRGLHSTVLPSIIAENASDRRRHTAGNDKRAYWPYLQMSTDQSMSLIEDCSRMPTCASPADPAVLGSDARLSCSTAVRPVNACIDRYKFRSSQYSGQILITRMHEWL